MKKWLRAIRAPFFTASIVPVILGVCIAYYEKNVFHIIYFILTLLGAIFIHAGLNLSNDYFDHLTGADELNKFPTPFSGGSRVIQDNLIKAKYILIASLIFFLLGSIIGLYLNYVCKGNIILLIGIIGVFIAFFYTAVPLKLGYRSIGEILVGVGFGPLIVTGAYYVQTNSLSLLPILTSIPIGILIALVLYINEFPDYEPDKEVGKRTIVVTLGREKALKLFFALLIFTYIFVIIAIITKLFPLYALITLFTFPLAIKIMVVAKNNYTKIYELLPANATTILLHLIFGLLLSLSFILAKLYLFL